MADEYALHGITINTVARGSIATKTTKWYLAEHEGQKTDEEQRGFLVA